MFAMLRRRRTGIAAPLLTLVTAAALPTLAGDPVGLWLVDTEEAHIKIRECGEELCGTIVWMMHPSDEDGRIKRDVHNPDESLRRRTIVGLTILKGLPHAPDAEGTYDGGTIYDPQRGQAFRCTMRLESDDVIKLHAFLGIPLLGRTTTWTRIEPGEPPPAPSGE